MSKVDDFLSLGQTGVGRIAYMLGTFVASAYEYGMLWSSFLQFDTRPIVGKAYAYGREPWKAGHIL